MAATTVKPCLISGIWICAAGSLGAASVTAANASQLGVLECRAIQSDADRLRCYDDVAARLASETKPPAEQGDVDTGIVARAPAGEAAQPTDATRPIAEATAAETSAAAAPEAEGFGAEDLRAQAPREKKAQKDRVLVAGVVDVAKNGRGKYLIILDNGQVWRQLKADTNNLLVPKNLEDETARIRRKSMGSHILSLSSGRRSIRVERIK
ncbi:MAG: hypothetical protein AAFX08_05930 [Pseudomonadota bacterium]